MIKIQNMAIFPLAITKWIQFIMLIFNGLGFAPVLIFPLKNN
jgi:hypothetical protein